MTVVDEWKEKISEETKDNVYLALMACTFVDSDDRNFFSIESEAMERNLDDKLLESFS